MSDQEYRSKDEWDKLMNEAMDEAMVVIPNTNWQLTSTYDDLPLVRFSLDWDDEISDPDTNKWANEALSAALKARGLAPGGLIDEKLDPKEIGYVHQLVGEEMERFGPDAIEDAIAEAEAAVPGTHWVVNWPGGGDLTGARFWYDMGSGHWWG